MHTIFETSNVPFVWPVTRKEASHPCFKGEALLLADLYAKGPAQICIQKGFYYEKLFINLESLKYYQNIDVFKYYAFRHFMHVFE